MSSLAERNAGLERIVEAERHDAVAEDHGLLLAAVTIDLVDDAEISFWSSACDDVETASSASSTRSIVTAARRRP